MAASWAALPSMVIFSGTPWRRVAFFRKRGAASSSRCSVCRKSIGAVSFFPSIGEKRRIPKRSDQGADNKTRITDDAPESILQEKEHRHAEGLGFQQPGYGLCQTHTRGS